MLNEELYQCYLKILHEELVPSLGCTEPIALAYAAALTRKYLGIFPVHMDVFCSGNIIKNVKSVTVPNSGGMRGIEAAAVLGAVGGDAEKKLEVLEHISAEDRKKTSELIGKKFCTCFLADGMENLYICVKMDGGGHNASVTIAKRHTQVTEIRRDGQIIFTLSEEKEEHKKEDIRELLNVRDILQFADSVEIAAVQEVIGRQVEMNTAIAEEGLKNHYGAEVGRTLISEYGMDVRVRAKAKAAAGSDARMNGCAMPVVINSGSGNQGMTCSLPVIEFASEWKASEEQLYRALVVSNLISIHQKKYIGSLSAYCGAVSAACGAGAAITYLYGGNYEAVSRTITNTIANMGGVVCDGAKSSCAAKIASAVDAAIMAYTLENKNHFFLPGEGLVKGNVEETIKSIGYVGREGMKSTDIVILNLMINKLEA